MTYVYDNDGELTDTTDADGRRTTYSYDSDGNQTGETWVGSSPAEKITYTYDADHELTGADDAYATLTFTYDSGGNNITSATSGPGTGQPSVTLTSGYDSLHNLTSLSDNISGNLGLTTFVYDASERLTTITTSYGGTAGPEIVTSYAPNDQISAQSRTIGGSGTEVNTTYQYDAADRQTTITDYVSGGSALATYLYSYDNANRVTTDGRCRGNIYLHVRQRQRTDERVQRRNSGRVLRIRRQRQPNRDRVLDDGDERNLDLAGRHLHV